MNGITPVQFSGNLMFRFLTQPCSMFSVAGVVRRTELRVTVRLLPMLCLGIVLSSSAFAQPPIKIQPRRQQPVETPGQSTPLPQIIPRPKNYDAADRKPVSTDRTETLGLPDLVTEINQRQNFQIWLSRSVKATTAAPGDTTYQFVKPSNLTDIEVPYTSKVTVNSQLSELQFGAPWQYPYQLLKGTVTYRFSNTPFVSVRGIEELDALDAEFLKYSPILTRDSLLLAYSPRDNLFQRDTELRLRRNVPESLLQKMNSSQIDEQLIENRYLTDRNGPTELRTLLWLTGLLDKVDDSLQRSQSDDEKIEVLTNISDPVLVYQEGMYYYIYNQCVLTAIRSTLEPEVIHLCLIEFEMHRYKEFIGGVLPNFYDLRGYRYKLSRTWSLGELK